MSLIREVKERVDIVKVAQYYGIKLDRAYKSICPFHTERTASFSISPSKQIWHCFGCGKGGDVISLVSELFNMNAYQSAMKINNDFSLGLEGKKTTYFEVNKYKQKQSLEESFKNWELQTFITLTDYLHLLWNWRELKDPENDLYIEALHQAEYIEYIVDTIFIEGTNEDKIWYWKNQKKVVKRIERRIRTFRTTGK